MPATTTAQLVERAKAAADMHDNFVTPKQWMYWATQERMSLDLFIARAGWTQDFETDGFTVTGSEGGDFNLTFDLMAIVAVHQRHTNGQVRRLRLSDTASFLRQAPGTTVVSGNAQEYRVRRVADSVQLQLYPAPVAGEVYLVTYLPHPLPLTLDSSPATGYANSVHYPMGWEERIVLGLARRALDKEESDSTPVQRQIGAMNQEIEQLCWDRVTSDAPSIINRDMDMRGWVDRISYPNPIGWWWA